MRVYLAGGLILAAIYVAVAAPIAALGRRFGWRASTYASVGLHRLLCGILHIKVRRIGAPYGAARLVVANHVSWLDILVLAATEPLTFLAKKEVGANLWTRWLVALQGAVFVDRARRRCIPQVNAKIARNLNVGASIVLFAEGTTSDGVRLLPFRSSHFEAARVARANVQPIYLNYQAVGGLHATRRDLLTVAWYGDMPFFPSLLRVLACGGIICDVRYGEIIKFDAEPDRKRLARRAEAALRTLKSEVHEESVSPL